MRPVAVSVGISLVSIKSNRYQRQHNTNKKHWIQPHSPVHYWTTKNPQSLEESGLDVLLDTLLDGVLVEAPGICTAGLFPWLCYCFYCQIYFDKLIECTTWAAYDEPLMDYINMLLKNIMVTVIILVKNEN